MNRRTFLGTSAAAGLAYSSIATTAAEIAKGPVKRVALIGSGWYGKIDLFRLIQVAPVEVVALCDDSTMLSDAADEVAKRQKSGKRPKTYADYRTLLKKNELTVLIATPDHWHALPMIDAVKSGCDVYVKNRRASTWWKVRRCWQRHASTIALCRWARSAAAPPTRWKQRKRSSTPVAG